MRNRWSLWSLLFCFFTMTGCAVSRSSMTAARPSRPTIARAESDHLSDLSSSAREKKSAAEKPQRDRDSKRHSSATCSRCNNSPCTCSGSCSDDSSTSLIASLGLMAVLSPFSVPKAVLENEQSEHLTFLPHPYADDLPGVLAHRSEQSEKDKEWAGTLQTFAIPETSDITRMGGRLVLESTARIGIDTETNYWTESFATGTSHLWIGDANLVYRFAQSERVQYRAGVGVNWMADSNGAEGGFNFTYGVDWFPAKPWTIATVFDVGTLGGGSLFHNRTTAGVMVGPIEAFAGYDYFQIGSTIFHGPVAGLGWRF